jgi:Domain of unknown function (DUF4062)
MIRKFQVFVSSTFEDMKLERQAAVEAILEAGHIPAGMELFTAGDESQLDTIKRWIEASDVYVLLLGGRYGSIEPKSGKSYIHVEYEYALELAKPVFAIVITDKGLEDKVTAINKIAIEPTYGQLLQQFRQQVLSKTSRFFDDRKDIKIAIHQKLAELSQRDDLAGWIPGDVTQNVQSLATELATLSQENRSLRDQLEAIKKTSGLPPEASTFELPANLTDDDIIAVLTTVLKQTPKEKRYSVMFFDHIDRAVKLPPGSAKRLLPKAAEKLYNIDSLTENSITLKERPTNVSFSAPARPREIY